MPEFARLALSARILESYSLFLSNAHGHNALSRSWSALSQAETGLLLSFRVVSDRCLRLRKKEDRLYLLSNLHIPKVYCLCSLGLVLPLPLKRDKGLDISRSTMDRWVMCVGELLLPSTGAMRRELLHGADETPVDVQMHDSRGENQQDYLWQYGTPGGGVVFNFRMGRGATGEAVYRAIQRHRAD